jgi:trehalose 6-phosphate synthase/phosphatase
MHKKNSTHLEIINVSNRLPVHIGDTLEKSAGGLVSAFEDISHCYSTTWLGWPGSEIPAHDKLDLEQRLREQNCVPIYISEEDIHGYYHLFSNSSLWPLFHYFTSYASYSSESFEVYRKVNEQFVEKIADMTQPNGIVWVHDYHLMLVPELLRKKRPDIKIGFFLHTPFPSHEVFRCHPYREELLKGVLGSDLIGFHTFSYLRHFRSSILRILGIDSEIDLASYEGRHVGIGVFPIGISWVRMESVLNSKKCVQVYENYKKHYKGKKIVLSVERLDYTKGIPEKLDVIEKYLKTYPAMREHVIFIQVAIPSREEVEWNKKIEEKVVQKISYINGKYSTINNIPIQFMFRTLPLDELCALYRLADVALVTPLVDGMNLVAKEFIACQKDSPGILVLSEFAGSAQELFSATHVNPYDSDGFLKALTESLEATPSQACAQTMIMRDSVIQYHSTYWAQNFLKTLTSVRQPHVTARLNCISQSQLDKWQVAKRVLLFIDYDGTLRTFEKNPNMAAPSKNLLHFLRYLSNYKEGWDLYLISGRSKNDLSAWFSDLSCGLIAEHGYSWRDLGATDWKTFKEEVDLEWKEEVKKVFQFYMSSTPGSFVEEKNASVVWHYRKSDPEFGEWKARLLTGELYELTVNMPVEVRHGQKIIEVCSQHINKGEAVKKKLHKHYDCVICVGDDLTDEHMFQLPDPRLISIKVGQGKTEAQNRFGDPQAFIEFLKEVSGYKEWIDINCHRNAECIENATS